MAVLGLPMWTHEQCVETQVPSRPGKGISGIAKEFGVSHNTVREDLRDPRTQRRGPRLVRSTMLDPYRAYFESRIAAARPRWFAATVLQQEIRKGLLRRNQPAEGADPPAALCER